MEHARTGIENQPDVSLHQVDPLWHLHLAMILKPLERGKSGADTTHNDGINLLLWKAARAMVNSCWLTSLTKTDGIFSERISVIIRARVVRC